MKNINLSSAVFVQLYRLTHLCLASHKRDICKQCRLRLDAPEYRTQCLIRSTLLALNSEISLKHNTELCV